LGNENYLFFRAHICMGAYLCTRESSSTNNLIRPYKREETGQTQLERNVMELYFIMLLKPYSMLLLNIHSCRKHILTGEAMLALVK